MLAYFPSPGERPCGASQNPAAPARTLERINVLHQAGGCGGGEGGRSGLSCPLLKESMIIGGLESRRPQGILALEGPSGSCHSGEAQEWGKREVGEARRLFLVIMWALLQSGLFH